MAFLFIDFFIFIYFFHFVNVFCLLPIYVYHSTVWRLWSVEKGVGFPRTGVKGGCELPLGAGDCT